jgi:hypothetical protein
MVHGTIEEKRIVVSQTIQGSHWRNTLSCITDDTWFHRVHVSSAIHDPMEETYICITDGTMYRYKSY